MSTFFDRSPILAHAVLIASYIVHLTARAEYLNALVKHARDWHEASYSDPATEPAYFDRIIALMLVAGRQDLNIMRQVVRALQDVPGDYKCPA